MKNKDNQNFFIVVFGNFGYFLSTKQGKPWCASLCVCLCLCVCACVCVRVYVCVYIYIYIYIYVYMCVCICVCWCVCVINNAVLMRLWRPKHYNVSVYSYMCVVY